MLRLRDTLRHTYADFLTWPEDERTELIDGIAYVREPPAPSRCHQRFSLPQLPATIKSGRYGPPLVLGLTGRTALSATPGVCIDWDRLQSD